MKLIYKLIYKDETGRSQPVRWGVKNAKAYDKEGNKIKVPICEQCKSEKSCIMGKEASMYFCFKCQK